MLYVGKMPEIESREAGTRRGIEDFRDLIAWQKAHALVLSIYKITKKFPEDERFGLTIQMRRAAVSVAANLAEGFKRRGEKGKVQSYNISQGSLEEVRYYLILTHDLGYGESAENLMALCDETGRLITGLINSAGAISPGKK